MEPKLWKKLPKKKLLQLYKKINFGILQKQIYDTMGPILLSRSQEDSTKIKKSGDLLWKLRRIEDMKKVSQSKIECARKNV